MAKEKDSRQVLAKNKKAFHEYDILTRFEAGIVLQGTEVKSARDHGVNLKESYARLDNHEIWLVDCHISPYSCGNIQNHEPLRPRKLLLHKKEIEKLAHEITRGGLTVVPLSMYLKAGKVKVEIALAKGRKLYDKREKARRKTIDRDIEIAMKTK
ncbi:MAG: SsrA-binding protein SmpB [Acidobacteriota bacterium]